jgi:hypothetical protein
VDLLPRKTWRGGAHREVEEDGGTWMKSGDGGGSGGRGGREGGSARW